MAAKKRITINGFGRIGRAAFRILHERDDCDVVAINDLTDAKTLAHLLSYDSVFRRYEHTVLVGDGAIIVDDVRYPVLQEPDPTLLPWSEYNVDVVLECTGRFTKDGAAHQHIDAGAGHVVLSAPAKGTAGGVGTHVLGVSDGPISAEYKVISNASCTTNSVAPIVRTLEDTYGIAEAMLTTIHSYTATQNLQDGPHKDLRRARAAAQNMIPTSTGAARVTTEVIPELENKFDGIAVRVPTVDVSLSDCTFVLKKSVTAEDVNATLRAAASGPLRGILGVTDEPLVSSDFIGNPHSSVVDLGMTRVVGGTLVKVVAWYDNEWGYANRLVDLAVTELSR